MIPGNICYPVLPLISTMSGPFLSVSQQPRIKKRQQYSQTHAVHLPLNSLTFSPLCNSGHLSYTVKHVEVVPSKSTLEHSRRVDIS